MTGRIVLHKKTLKPRGRPKLTKLQKAWRKFQRKMNELFGQSV